MNMPKPRPTFRELYQKYKQQGIPRWAYFIYFLLILTAIIWVYVKGPACLRPGSSCSSCSKQAQPAAPEQPRIIRVF